MRSQLESEPINDDATAHAPSHAVANACCHVHHGYAGSLRTGCRVRDRNAWRTMHPEETTRMEEPA
jgi:hypothetical protein